MTHLIAGIDTDRQMQICRPPFGTLCLAFIAISSI
jgi:hypothetical protein